MKDGVIQTDTAAASIYKKRAEMWGSITPIRRPARTYSFAHDHSTHRTDTHMQCPHTHSSGPHKLDVRLLLYRDCHNVDGFYSSGAKQRTCGFSVVFLGSSSAENNPVIICQISRLERPEHAPRSPPGPQTCAVVYRRAPCVPRIRERQKRPTGAGEEHANPPKTVHSYIVLQGSS